MGAQRGSHCNVITVNKGLWGIQAQFLHLRHLRLRGHHGRGGQKDWKSQRSRTSDASILWAWRGWGQMNPWNLNRMAAWTRLALWQHQLAYQHGQGKFHMTPPLDNNLCVVNGYCEREKQSSPEISSAQDVQSQVINPEHMLTWVMLNEVSRSHMCVFIYIPVYTCNNSI